MTYCILKVDNWKHRNALHKLIVFVSHKIRPETTPPCQHLVGEALLLCFEAKPSTGLLDFLSAEIKVYFARVPSSLKSWHGSPKSGLKSKSKPGYSDSANSNQKEIDKVTGQIVCCQGASSCGQNKCPKRTFWTHYQSHNAIWDPNLGRLKKKKH